MIEYEKREKQNKAIKDAYIGPCMSIFPLSYIIIVIIIIIIFFVELRTKPRTLCFLGKHAITELNP